MHPRLQAIYLVRCDAPAIEERARAIAVEQSVEMPLSAIADDFVRSQIVGRVEGITERQDRLFAVRISLAAETAGRDPGQLVNMLFGNTSIHDDVVLHDVELPAEFVRAFEGPRHGIEPCAGEVATHDLIAVPPMIWDQNLARPERAARLPLHG